MTLRSSDLQSDSDLDSIRNSCDVFVTFATKVPYSTFCDDKMRQVLIEKMDREGGNKETMSKFRE